jgi:hypothetical protein
VFKLIILISKGLIRNQRARRVIMFYDVIFALVMLFTGSTVLSGWLRENPLLFIVYWAACAWITLLAVLLAIFDMLLLRGAARRARRELEAEYLRKAKAREARERQEAQESAESSHGENSPRA